MLTDTDSVNCTLHRFNAKAWCVIYCSSGSETVKMFPDCVSAEDANDLAAEIRQKGGLVLRVIQVGVLVAAMKLVKKQDHELAEEPPAEPDLVNHPAHYTSHPSGIECIQITEHYGFNIGNTIKYLWRAGLKNDAIEDMEKARWYLDREISKRESESKSFNGLPR